MVPEKPAFSSIFTAFVYISWQTTAHICCLLLERKNTEALQNLTPVVKLIHKAVFYNRSPVGKALKNTVVGIFVKINP